LDPSSGRRRLLGQLGVQRGDVVYDHQVLVEPLEHLRHPWLQVVEEQRLLPQLEVHHHGGYHLGGREVRSIDVRAVDDHWQRGLLALLVDHLAHKLHRGEDQAAVGGEHQVLQAGSSL